MENGLESHGDAFKRCAAQFGAEQFQRELLGRPGARYSAIFVFLWGEAMGMGIHRGFLWAATPYPPLGLTVLDPPYRVGHPYKV